MALGLGALMSAHEMRRYSKAGVNPGVVGPGTLMSVHEMRRYSGAEANPENTVILSLP